MDETATATSAKTSMCFSACHVLHHRLSSVADRQTGIGGGSSVAFERHRGGTSEFLDGGILELDRKLRTQFLWRYVADAITIGEASQSEFSLPDYVRALADQASLLRRVQIQRSAGRRGR